MKTLLRVLIILAAAGLVVAALVAFSNTETGAALLGANQPQGDGLGQGLGDGQGLGQGNGNGRGQGQGAGNGNHGEGGGHSATGISWDTWLKNLSVIGALVLFMVLLDTLKSVITKKRRGQRRVQTV